jgi:hypothetical protein
MEVRFKKKSDIFNIAVTGLAGVLSVGIMLYGVGHFGLKNSWPELVLNLFYIACLAMMWLYFFQYRITTQQFNYWCTLCLGITVLLRDVLFPPPLAAFVLLGCRFLSVLLLLVLLYFYARKDWESFSKRNLWMICIIDMLLAGLYHLDILLEPTDEYTAYMLTEIWIRPTITYGLVACFIQEKNNQS